MLFRENAPEAIASLMARIEFSVLKINNNERPFYCYWR